MGTWLQGLWHVYRRISTHKYGFYQVFMYLCVIDVNNMDFIVKKESDYERHKNGYRGCGDY